jgi:integrase
LYRGSRVDKVWSAEDETAFLEKAPAHLHLALLLALWTGQRQGDLLKLTWFQYDGFHIKLQQGKTKARVSIPLGIALRAALDAVPKEAKKDRVLLTLSGTPWTSNGFSSSFRKAMGKAGVVGLTFHDTRGTAVTRLAVAGCTVPEIATFTGHSLKDVQSILDAHYLHRDPAMAESALRKLERRTETPN